MEKFDFYANPEKHQRLVHEITEENEAPSSKTVYDLPLEMLDIILQKSYRHWILNFSTKQRDEEVIRSLISVDVCFNRRITRQRLKKAIWRYLKDCYGKTKKRYAIIRNNRNYLLENIQPNDELIASLLSLNCITEEQSHFIQLQRANRKKNDEILQIVRSFDKTKFSNFVNCLRQTNQKTVAMIIESGGAQIKTEVQIRGEMCETSMEAALLHQKLEDLKRQTVVVWILCHSQAALEDIQRLFELNQLRVVFFENIQPSVSKVIDIDGNQFKKTIVVCPISINFTRRIEIGGRENKYVLGVTKLRNEIYILCESLPCSSSHVMIRVFEDRNPFRLLKTIEVNEMKNPIDIGSSDKGNCLYVSDGEGKCVWKITRETADQHKIIKWLTTDYQPSTLSMSNDGRLLMVSYSSSILRIYGSDAELIRSIQLPQRDIGLADHAVETSIGNFIICHKRIEEVKGESGSSGRKMVIKWGISEVTRDGQMVIRRFIPSNETHQLNQPYYLSLDSDYQMFVADYANGRVILLDSDLKWNQILCPTKEEPEETKIRRPRILCYDDEKKQLIVGGFEGVNVYTLSRN